MSAIKPPASKSGEARLPCLAMDKRIAPDCLLKIFSLLTNQERACCLRVNREVRQLVKMVPAHIAFKNLQWLIGGCCVPFPLRNAENPQTRVPRPFGICAYDAHSQCVITGDYCAGNASSNPSVKIWNREARMVRHLTEQERFWERITFVGLDETHGRAAAAFLDGKVRVWNARTGQLVDAVNQHYGLNLCHGDVSTGEFVRSSSYGSPYIELLQKRAGTEELQPVRFAETPPYSMSWVHDVPKINRVFSCTRSGDLQIWDRRTLKSLATLAQVSSGKKQYAYDPKDNLLFVWVMGKEMRRLNAITGEVLGSGMGLSQALHIMHYDPVKKWVFASFNDSSSETTSTKIIIFDGVSGRLGKKTWDGTLGTSVPAIAPRMIQCLDTRHYPLNEIDFDPETNTVLTGGNGVQLWDLHSGKLLRDEQNGKWTQVRWDPKNKLFVCFNEHEGAVTIFDYSIPQAPPVGPPAGPQERLEGKRE